MAKRKQRYRRWSYVTLHWTLVSVLVINFVTGVTISFASPYDPVLPAWLANISVSGQLTSLHIISAMILLGIMVAYSLLLITSGETKRLSLAKTLSLIRHTPRKSPWALRTLIYWLIFAVTLLLALTGFALFYFAEGFIPGAEPWYRNLHWFGALSLGLIAILHLLEQLIVSGPRSYLSMLVPKWSGLRAGSVALGSAAVITLFIYFITYLIQPKLTVAWTDSPPRIDGQANDPQWQDLPYHTVYTVHGSAHQVSPTPVMIKALFDEKSFYFLARWPDSTLSTNHLPLVKTDRGWKIKQTRFIVANESQYYEDKFALMIAKDNQLAGNGTFHYGKNPLTGKPGGGSGRGLHYTEPTDTKNTDDETKRFDSIVDVWHWKSVRTGSMGQADDEYFGPPLPHRDCERRYAGGYTPDPMGGKTYKMNWLWYGEDIVTPKRLPLKHGLLSTERPDVPGKALTWAKDSVLHWEETQAYRPELDTYPVGTILPSVLLLGKSYGDRGNVSAQAEWENGWWTLEMSRRLETSSVFDVDLVDGHYIWVSVFDHAQTEHTYHLQGIRLDFEPAPTGVTLMTKNKIPPTYYFNPKKEKAWQFDKVAADGTQLAPLAGPWRCVTDRSTGLLWEIKTDNEGLNFYNWTYTWFQDGQGQAKGGICNFDTINCDTQTHIDKLNAMALCGRSDWRLPSPKELKTLIYPQPQPEEAPIPHCYFPHTVKGAYWTEKHFREDGELQIAVIDFSTTNTLQYSASDQAHIRLVAGKRKSQTTSSFSKVLPASGKPDESM